jgi:general secretion pathway protein K
MRTDGRISSRSLPRIVPVNRRERGFALLIVLWSAALLALLATQLTSAGRSELQVAANIRTSAKLEAQADGLVYATIFRLMNDSPVQRGVDGRDHGVAVSGGRGLVRVTSLAGKINPNTASEELLTALLQQLGVPAQRAVSLAAAIADWRTPGQVPRPGGAKAAQYSQAGLPYTPPGAPFQTVGEIQLVLGMTPELFSRLAPHLTVFYPGDPVWAAADPVVAAILKAAGPVTINTPAEGLDNDGVYVEIAAQVTGDAGTAFTRRAIAWVGHGSLRGRYRVLSWDVPA